MKIKMLVLLSIARKADWQSISERNETTKLMVMRNGNDEMDINVVAYVKLKKKKHLSDSMAMAKEEGMRKVLSHHLEPLSVIPRA